MNFSTEDLQKIEAELSVMDVNLRDSVLNSMLLRGGLNENTAVFYEGIKNGHRNEETLFKAISVAKNINYLLEKFKPESYLEKKENFIRSFHPVIEGKNNFLNFLRIMKHLKLDKFTELRHETFEIGNNRFAITSHSDLTKTYLDILKSWNKNDYKDLMKDYLGKRISKIEKGEAPLKAGDEIDNSGAKPRYEEIISEILKDMKAAYGEDELALRAFVDAIYDEDKFTNKNFILKVIKDCFENFPESEKIFNGIYFKNRIDDLHYFKKSDFIIHKNKDSTDNQCFNKAIELLSDYEKYFSQGKASVDMKPLLSHLIDGKFYIGEPDEKLLKTLSLIKKYAPDEFGKFSCRILSTIDFRKEDCKKAKEFEEYFELAIDNFMNSPAVGEQRLKEIYGKMSLISKGLNEFEETEKKLTKKIEGFLDEMFFKSDYEKNDVFDFTKSTPALNRFRTNVAQFGNDNSIDAINGYKVFDTKKLTLDFFENAVKLVFGSEASPEEQKKITDKYFPEFLKDSKILQIVISEGEKDLKVEELISVLKDKKELQIFSKFLQLGTAANIVSSVDRMHLIRIEGNGIYISSIFEHLIKSAPEVGDNKYNNAIENAAKFVDAIKLFNERIVTPILVNETNAKYKQKLIGAISKENLDILHTEVLDNVMVAIVEGKNIFGINVYDESQYPTKFETKVTKADNTAEIEVTNKKYLFSGKTFEDILDIGANFKGRENSELSQNVMPSLFINKHNVADLNLVELKDDTYVTSENKDFSRKDEPRNLILTLKNGKAYNLKLQIKPIHKAASGEMVYSNDEIAIYDVTKESDNNLDKSYNTQIINAKNELFSLMRSGELNINPDSNLPKKNANEGLIPFFVAINGFNYNDSDWQVSFNKFAKEVLPAGYSRYEQKLGMFEVETCLRDSGLYEMVMQTAESLMPRLPFRTERPRWLEGQQSFFDSIEQSFFGNINIDLETILKSSTAIRLVGVILKEGAQKWHEGNVIDITALMQTKHGKTSELKEIIEMPWKEIVFSERKKAIKYDIERIAKNS